MVSRGAVRHALWFGLAAGALIAAMQVVQYRFVVVEHSIEIYGALVAGAFAAAGIWLGLKITREKELAARLFVSENTAKTHIGRVLEKLGASRRTQAVQLAKQARLIPAIAVPCLAVIGAACGGGGGGTSTSPTTEAPDPVLTSSLVFTASPIAESAIRWITPLGNLNPPSHALPTDHIYFYFADPSNETAAGRRTTFYAPAGGRVFAVIGGAAGQESKLFIRATSKIWFYLDHLILSSAIANGAVITAGQALGTSGTAYGVDLGVVNEARTLPGFVNPSRYTVDTLSADGPLKYFAEPLRSRLYARVERQGADLDGKIDFDVPGRLVGNWFITNSASLSFVYDTWDPNRVLISMGAGQLIGVFGIGAGEPNPRDVSVATGPVVYTLYSTSNGPRGANPGNLVGQMRVQMTSDTQILWEVFGPNATPGSPTAFTSSVRTFTR